MQFPDLNDLFAGITQRESLIFLAFCLVSFLFGLLVGYLLRSRRVRALRRELKKKEAEISQRDEKIIQLTSELALRDADVKKRQYQLEDLKEKDLRWEAEKGKLTHQLNYLKEELEKERAGQESLQSTIEDLNEQILGLRAKSGQLSSDATDTARHHPDMAQRIASIESKVRQLEAENERLEGTVAFLQNKELEDRPSIAPFSPGDKVNEEPDISTLTATEDILQLDRSKFQPDEKDDLSKIDGIGPFLEKKLNQAGVYTYDQISRWTSEDIKRITQEIQFFEGRIEKDNWVGQAQVLKSSGSGEEKRADQPFQPFAEPDNLQLIEGIGLKVENILKEAGIQSFQALAKTDPQDLEDLLEKEDPRLLIYEPHSWPAQARLAANAEWEVLKDYQEQLRKGKE